MLQNIEMPPCRDCKQPWTFTVMEQALAIERNHTNPPSRCPACRAKRASRREQGLVTGRNERQEKKQYTAVCSQCGGEAIIPFKPRNDRPVYCQECHRAHLSAG